MYYSKDFVERPGLWKQLFPTPKHENLVIGVCGVGSAKDFSCLITNQIPDLEFVSKSQCFPLYYYTEQKTERDGDLFDDVTSTENNPQI